MPRILERVARALQPECARPNLCPALPGTWRNRDASMEGRKDLASPPRAGIGVGCEGRSSARSRVGWDDPGDGKRAERTWEARALRALPGLSTGGSLPRIWSMIGRSGWLGLGILLMAIPIRGADWPQWRGSDGSGISSEANWTIHWPGEGPKVAWKAQVGTGFASFAIANGRVFTQGHDDDEDVVHAFDVANGRELWRHGEAADLGDKFFEGGPTSTPAVDADGVYVVGRWGTVRCLSPRDGTARWTRNLQQDHGFSVPGWGFSGSPRILGDRLLLTMGEAGAVLDRRTGKTLWASGTRESGYSTPVVATVAGNVAFLTSSGRSYAAVDVESGRVAWSFPWKTQYGVNAADPLVAGNEVLLTSGYNQGVALLRATGTNAVVVWQSKVLRAQFNPPVVRDGFIYGIDGDTTAKAVLKCIEWKTGVERWAFAGTGSGSVMMAGTQLVVLTDKGELLVAPVSPDGFKPVARAQVLGGRCWTTPVLSEGRLFCRNSRGDVVCLDLSAGSNSPK